MAMAMVDGAGYRDTGPCDLCNLCRVAIRQGQSARRVVRLVRGRRVSEIGVGSLSITRSATSRRPGISESGCGRRSHARPLVCGVPVGSGFGCGIGLTCQRDVDTCRSGIGERHSDRRGLLRSARQQRRCRCVRTGRARPRAGGRAPAAIIIRHPAFVANGLVCNSSAVALALALPSASTSHARPGLTHAAHAPVPLAQLAVLRVGLDALKGGIHAERVSHGVLCVRCARSCPAVHAAITHSP